MAIALAHHARQHSAPEVPPLTGTKRSFGARALEESPDATEGGAHGRSKRVRLAEAALDNSSNGAGGHDSSSSAAAAAAPSEQATGAPEGDADGESDEDEDEDEDEDAYDDEGQVGDDAGDSSAAGPQALFHGIDTHLRTAAGAAGGSSASQTAGGGAAATAAAAGAGSAGSTGSAHSQPMRMWETKLAGPHYRGVERLNLAGPTPWAARVVRQGKRIRLGQFRTAEAAARAYDKRTLQEKGAGGAVLMNFPSEANAVLAQIAAERARGLGDEAAVTAVSDAPPPFDYNPQDTLHPKTAAALRRHSVPLPAAGGVGLPTAAATPAAAASAAAAAAIGGAGHGQPALPGLGSASARTDGAGFAPYAPTGSTPAGGGAIDAASASAAAAGAGAGACSGLSAAPASAFDATSGRAVLHGVDGGGGDGGAASGSFARWSVGASAGEPPRQRTPAGAAGSAAVSVQHMHAELLASTAAIGESLFQLDHTRSTMLRLMQGMPAPVSSAGAAAGELGSADCSGAAAAVGIGAAGAAEAAAGDSRRQQLERALAALEAAYGTMCAAAARTAIASSYGSGIAIAVPPAVTSAADAAAQAQRAAATADFGSEATAASAAVPVLYAAPGAGHNATQFDMSPASAAAAPLQAAVQGGSLAAAVLTAGRNVPDVAGELAQTESMHADGLASVVGAPDDADESGGESGDLDQSKGENGGVDRSEESGGGSEPGSDADEWGA
jgi:hypothetical protein